MSAAALEAQQKRVNQMFKFGAMSEDDWRSECREIAAQRERLMVRPAPLFTQQQSVLQTLVGAWGGLNADERKQTLAGIFDCITARADGVDRLEPCEEWRPFMVAAIPKPVKVPTAPAGVTGAEDGTRIRRPHPLARMLRVRDGGLDVVRRAA